MKRFTVAVLALCSVLLFAKGRELFVAESKYFGRYPAITTPPRLPRAALDDVYSSGPIHLAIPDQGAVSDTITVNNNATIEDCNIYLRVTHSWIRDLRITVTHVGSSETDTVSLINTFPGDSIVDMDVWFDSDADSSIIYGASWVVVDSADSHLTLAGTWQPMTSLDSLDGVRAGGSWILNVIDRFALDTGFVEEWAVEVNRTRILRGTALDFETGEPIPGVKVEALPGTAVQFTNSAGIYGFDILQNGTYNIRFTKQYYDTVIVPDVVIEQGNPRVVNADLTFRAVDHEYGSTASPIGIIDGNPDTSVTMLINVPDNFTIGDVDVTVNATHPFVGDLSFVIENPNNVRVNLVSVGAQCPDIGQDLVNCTFDDESADSYLEGTGAHSGRYLPAGSLSQFDGQFSVGDWTLEVTDHCEIDTGTINSFSLHIVEILSAAPNHPAPYNFDLFTAYPNPFNSTIKLEFELAAPLLTRLDIYDLTGRLAATLADGRLSAGKHHFYFSANQLASGVYFAKLQTPGNAVTKKILLLK